MTALIDTLSNPHFHFFQVQSFGNLNFINPQATDDVFCVACAVMNINENDVGAVYYRTSTDGAILSRAEDATAGSAFSATFAVIVTWHKLTSAGNGDLVS